jgi:hypothetical protein
MDRKDEQKARGREAPMIIKPGDLVRLLKQFVAELRRRAR